MPTLRTLIPPRFRDAYSFSGVGRWQYQRAIIVAPPTAPSSPGGVFGDIYGDLYGEGAIVGASLGAAQLVPIEPVHDGAPVPIRG